MLDLSQATQFPTNECGYHQNGDPALIFWNRISLARSIKQNQRYTHQSHHVRKQSDDTIFCGFYFIEYIIKGKICETTLIYFLLMAIKRMEIRIIYKKCKYFKVKYENKTQSLASV